MSILNYCLEVLCPAILFKLVDNFQKKTFVIFKMLKKKFKLKFDFFISNRIIICNSFGVDFDSHENYNNLNIILVIPK